MSRKLACIFFFFLLQNNCGGSGSSVGTNTDSSDDSNTVNTAKLVNTPFEGLESGDDFPDDEFRTGNYLTENVNINQTIKIFLAYFSIADEAIIQEGVEIANTAIGHDIFEVTEEWSDDARVIYQVEDNIGESLAGSALACLTLVNRSHCEGKTYADVIITDWQIICRDSFNKYAIAHELGHAFGLYHALIDYQEDDLVDLELGSIMESGSTSNFLSDYTFMMETQYDLLQMYDGGADEDCINYPP